MRPLLALTTLAVALAWACAEPASDAPGTNTNTQDPVASSDAASPGPDAASAPDAGEPPDAALPDAGALNGREFKFHKPTGYDASKPTPLVVLLHGYGSYADEQNGYFGLTALSDARTFVLALPDGSYNQINDRFWNATDACCGYGAAVDDVAFLKALIGRAKADFNIDAKRVFVIGHSNGGFMAHRLACDDSAELAGIVSLAGDNWKDATKCAPTDGVAVLQVHGDQDNTVLYGGGYFFGIAYPAAKDSVATWASKNGCSATLTATGTRKDLVSNLTGSETRVERFDGCTKGAAELWTLEGGPHIPAFNASWAGAIYDFLAAHPKP